jgi:osmoprotectant transport system permease protein
VRARLALALLLAAGAAEAKPVVVCSKKFTEAVLLGELATQLLRSSGIAAEHRAQLGGTRVVWDALNSGACDVYAEYTGTLLEEILADQHLEGEAALERALAARGLRLGRRIGFDDSYAIGMLETRAAALGVRNVSDLVAHPALRFGFSEEFLSRGDGWPGLRDRYSLPQRDVRAIDHDLAYRGLASGALDAIDVYTTDAEIDRYHLRPLVDDRHYFREYQAVLVSRADLAQRAPGAQAVLARIEGKIDAQRMRELNGQAKLEGVPESRVAAEFLATLGVRGGERTESRLGSFGRRTAEHLFLVGLSLLAALLVSLPLGILAAKRPRLGQLVLAATGILQTIPSLALLVALIPLLGIGSPPALAALFLYSMLPIVRNTFTGLRDIPPALRESAEALGLSPRARLLRIELPMASRSILAGVKTSAVINVGTATLGAIIGAGGYGEPILTGIRLADVGLILQGAAPAAVLALAVQGLFELIERLVVPRGLRLHEGD